MKEQPISFTYYCNVLSICLVYLLLYLHYFCCRIRVRILHVLDDGRYEVGWIKEQGPGEEEEFCERSVEGMDTLE